MQFNRCNFHGSVFIATPQPLGGVENDREQTTNQNPRTHIVNENNEDNPVQPAMQETSHQQQIVRGPRMTTNWEQVDPPTSVMPCKKIILCGLVILMCCMYFETMTDWVLTLACWAIDVPMHQEMDSDGNPSPLHAWLSAINLYPTTTSDHCFQLSSSYIREVFYKRFFSVRYVEIDAWVELFFRQIFLYGPDSM